MKGSITVEAALLVPVVNIVIIVIILIAMMYHDRCVVREIAEREILIEESGKRSEEELGKDIMWQTDGNLLISRVDKVKVDINMTDIVVEAYVNCPLVSNYFGRQLEMRVKVKNHKTKGVGVVRLFTVVLDEINGIRMED